MWKMQRAPHNGRKRAFSSYSATSTSTPTLAPSPSGCNDNYHSNVNWKKIGDRIVKTPMHGTTVGLGQCNNPQTRYPSSWSSLPSPPSSSIPVLRIHVSRPNKREFPCLRNRAPRKGLTPSASFLPVFIRLYRMHSVDMPLPSR